MINLPCVLQLFKTHCAANITLVKKLSYEEQQDTTVSISARDRDGLTASKVWPVKIINKNDAPTVCSSIQGFPL